jgi:hypothetical protein
MGIFNFDVNVGRATFGEISMLTLGYTLGWNFDIINMVDIHERHAKQRGIWVLRLSRFFNDLV